MATFRVLLNASIGLSVFRVQGVIIGYRVSAHSGLRGIAVWGFRCRDSKL